MDKLFKEFLKDNAIYDKYLRSRNKYNIELKKNYLFSAFRFCNTPEGTEFWLHYHFKWLKLLNICDVFYALPGENND